MVYNTPVYLLWTICMLTRLSTYCQSTYPTPTIRTDSITIIRDEWGVPHIYAPTDPEVAYGLAWAQAEDNFEVIQQTLLFTRGMLGRVYGKVGAQGDFFSKLLRLDELVDSTMHEEVSPQFLSYLSGFCEGVNAYAKTHRKEVLHKKLFPITPQDVLTSYPLKIAEFMGLGNTVSGVLGGNRYDQAAKTVRFEPKGSNAFAFSRKITTDNHTYLIGNPHVDISGPEAFYEIHVASKEGLDFYGAMFPGSVSPQIGTNRHLGWSHTNNYYDHTDVFLLKMHPETPNLYEFDGAWLPLEEREIELKVNLKWIPFPLTVKRTVYQSKYGPTLMTPDSNFMAVRMATLFSIRAPEQWYRMNKAHNFEAFKQALAWNGLPYFNITYADKEDNIFYIFNGLFPERADGYDWEQVVPGNSSETLWDSFIPLEQRPQILNPDCGFVYNVNHSPFKCTCKSRWLDESDFDPHINYNGIIDDLPRSLRFRELYQEGDTISMSRLKAIKYDVSLPEQYFATAAIRQLQAYQDPQYEDILSIIRDWELEASLESAAPTLIYLYFESLKISNRELEIRQGQVPEANMKTALEFTRSHLMQHFGKLAVPFSEFSRIKRGNRELPVYGFRNALGNRRGKLDKENGKLYATGGDNYMLFVEYDDTGVVNFESIVPFGSSNRPDSPHYADQMEVYARKGTKKLTFDKSEILKKATAVYHPQ